MWTPDTSVIDRAADRPARQEETRRAAIPELSARQFWLAALELGITKSGLKAHARETLDGTELENMLILIGESSAFNRQNPVVQSLSAEMGISSDQLDSLWEWALTI